jgi:hypothetical protein
MVSTPTFAHSEEAQAADVFVGPRKRFFYTFVFSPQPKAITIPSATVK